MADKESLPSDSDEHVARVREAFDAFHEKLGEKLDDTTRESVEKLRQATADKDAERLREHMGEVRERHGWLYRELAEHPLVGEARGVGFIGALELVADKATRRFFPNRRAFSLHLPRRWTLRHPWP